MAREPHFVVKYSSYLGTAIKLVLYILKQLFASVSVNSGGYLPHRSGSVNIHRYSPPLRRIIVKYIKDKPTKWGIKLWILADSSNGYTCDFNIYRAAGREVSEHGLGYDVVMKLMQPFFHQGYHLFVDNFYTSFRLVSDLFEQGVPATGTVREHRAGFPASLRGGRDWAKHKARGAMHWERVPPVLALKWKDNKVVSLLTTIDNANDSLQVDRKTKRNNAWNRIVVLQPHTIKRCNSYMNAVDRSDQMLATYNVLRKCMQW